MMISNANQRYKIMGVIPARGGSKGIPRKALQMLGNMPLIAYTIKDALAIEGVTKVFVNTDDPEIQTVSIEYGAEVPFLRPRELAQDDSSLEDAHRHALDWYRENQGFVPGVEIIMSPTHPFRRTNLVNTALLKGLEDPEIFNLGSIAPAQANLDNYWVKENGRMHRFSIPGNESKYRGPFYQSAFSFNIVFSGRSHLTNRRLPIVLNHIESIDIDEPKDLELARVVLLKGLYPFDAEYGNH
jgi:CMP-N,N'-diacetyllegionaminic acid synthase